MKCSYCKFLECCKESIQNGYLPDCSTFREKLKQEILTDLTIHFEAFSSAADKVFKEFNLLL